MWHPKSADARVDNGLAVEPNRLAQQNGRNRSVPIERASRSHVAIGRDFLAKVDADLASLEAGRVTDHAAMAAALRRTCCPAS